MKDEIQKPGNEDSGKNSPIEGCTTACYNKIVKD
jgi:hypothetical protein